MVLLLSTCMHSYYILYLINAYADFCHNSDTSETLDGLSTIRAYAKEHSFIHRNNILLDLNQQAYYMNFSANCWLAIRLEFTGACIVTCTALFAVLARDYNSYVGGTLGEGSGMGQNSDGSMGQNSEGDKAHQVAMFAGMAGLAISLALSVTQVCAYVY